MLINLHWLVTTIRNLWCCPYTVPAECLQIQAVHNPLIVVMSVHDTADEVHVFPGDYSQMMSYSTRHLATHLLLLPGHLIIMFLRPLLTQFRQVTDLREFEAPKVVKCTYSDVITTENVQLFIVYESGVIRTTLRLHTNWPELIPVDVFVVSAICFHGS